MALKFIYLCLLMAMTTRAYRTIKSAETNIILAKANETIDIVCDNNVPLIRCGFTHPNGTQILFINVVPGTPSCKFTTDATSSEIGLWTCHLWTPASSQEIQKFVEVRVAHKFAALNKDIRVKEGEEVTLSCVTTEGMIPLNDCSFISPSRNRIHLDDRTSKEHMVLNKYYYPLNMSVHRGDCGITISSASTNDAGFWSCSGWLELEHREYTDTLHVTVHDDTDIIYDAESEYISVIVYVCSSIGFLLIFATLVYCKYKYLTPLQGKTFGDDVSINSYMMKQRVDPSPLILADHLLIT